MGMTGRSAFTTPLARANVQDEVARVFSGQATCPACDAGLTVSAEPL